MTHTDVTAEDAVYGTLNTAWLASGTTSGIGLLFENVAVTEEDLAAIRYDPTTKKPLPYARAIARVLVSGSETVGGQGLAKALTEGILAVQLFCPPGDGHQLANAIVEGVLKPAFRGISVGELWFFDVYARRAGMDKSWFRTDFRASYRYREAI